MTPPPRLSVIIPSRDRPDLLRECLQSLRPELSGEVECIVVDDGSRTPLDHVAAAAGARYARVASVGLNAARNAGVEHARGAVVAFLDDDVLVTPGWSEAILAAMTAGADGVGGRIRLSLAAPPPRWLTPWLREYLGEYDRGEHPAWINDAPLPVGANCAVRRDVCLEVGGFQSGLDRSGGSLLSMGDTEFFRRVRGGGGRLRYAPGADVVHRIGPERLTLAYFRRRAFAQGRSDAVAGAAGAPSRPLRRLARPLRGVVLLIEGILRGHGPVPALLWLEYWRGRVTTR